MILGAEENELMLAGIGGLLICIASSLHLLIAGSIFYFILIIHRKTNRICFNCIWNGSVRKGSIFIKQNNNDNESQIINGNYQLFVD